MINTVVELDTWVHFKFKKKQKSFAAAARRSFPIASGDWFVTVSIRSGRRWSVDERTSGRWWRPAVVCSATTANVAAHVFRPAVLDAAAIAAAGQCDQQPGPPPATTTTKRRQSTQ